MGPTCGVGGGNPYMQVQPYPDRQGLEPRKGQSSAQPRLEHKCARKHSYVGCQTSSIGNNTALSIRNHDCILRGKFLAHLLSLARASERMDPTSCRAKTAQAEEPVDGHRTWPVLRDVIAPYLSFETTGMTQAVEGYSGGQRPPGVPGKNGVLNNGARVEFWQPS